MYDLTNMSGNWWNGHSRGGNALTCRLTAAPS
jgi:hypothetical protein